MYYPENFKNRVRSAYPDCDRVNALLEEESYELGFFLDYNIKTEGISYERILAATSLEELKDEARVHLERVALYNEWCNKFKKPRRPESIMRQGQLWYI